MACAVACVPAAHAAVHRVSSVGTLSGPDDLPAACAFAPGTEGESFLAADPVDPSHLVATWGAGFGDGAVTAATRDGGRTWARSHVPGLTTCTGGTRAWTIDGWVSVGRGGGAYFGAFSSAGDPPGGLPTDIDVLASGSPGGGTRWPAAAVVDTGLYGVNGIISRTSITADPHRPGRAWMVWSRMLVNPLVDGVYVARTDDGGETWGAPVRVAKPAQPGLALPAWQVVVLPDGTLLAAFGALQTQEDTLRGGLQRADTPVVAQTSRSTDGGETWSTPRDIGTLPSYVLGRLAADRRGEAWFAWGEPGTSDARIRVARSADAGQTWSAPIDAAVVPSNGIGPLDLQVSVAAARDGAIGVSWYDAASAPGELRHRFAASTDRGRTWRRLDLGPPFARETGGGNGDGPVGAYQGLAPLGKRSFAATWVEGTGQGASNPTEVRFARIVR